MPKSNYDRVKRLLRNEPDYAYVHAFVLVSDEGWRGLTLGLTQYGYTGRGPQHGISNYIRSLISNNASPASWTDTRPDDLKQFDLRRLEAGKLPMWTYEGARVPRQRSLRADILSDITPVLLALSSHFGIYGTRHTHDKARLNVVLDAIGQGWLTPSNLPDHCATPRAEKRAVWWENRKRKTELTY